MSQYLTIASNRKQLMTAIAASAGTSDANKLGRLGSAGRYDTTLLPEAIGYENILLNPSFTLLRLGWLLASGTLTPVAMWRFTPNVAGSNTAISSVGNFTWNQTSVPDFPKSYLEYTQTASNGTRGTIECRIEGAQSFSGETLSFAWWLWSDVAWSGSSLQITQNFSTGGTPSSSLATNVTVNGSTGFTIAANTWTLYTGTVTVPSVASATLGTNNNDFLSLALRPGGSNTGTIRIASPGVYLGAIAPTYQTRPLHVERLLCSRYWQRVVCAFDGNVTLGSSYAATGLLLPMRTTPTMSASSVQNTNFGATPSLAYQTSTGEAWLEDTRAATATGRGRMVSVVECSAEL